MKKYFSLLLIVSFLLTGCGASGVAENSKKPYDIEVVLASALSKSAFVEKTAIIKAGTQVKLTAQASGRVSGLLVQPGQTVVAGQTLVQLEDMYGTADNSLAEAQIALQNARLMLTSTSASLGQALSSTQIAYEKAEKDFLATQVSMKETLDQAERNATALESGTSGDTTTPLSKAELELANFIASQQQQLDAYETSYENQLQNFQSFLANVLDTSDTLLGVSEQNKTLNDSYEYLLSAKDSQQKIVAEDILRKLLTYKEWSLDATLPLLDRVTELQKAHTLVNSLLAATETVLINSVTDATLFPPATLATQRALIDGYQTQYSGISTALVSFLNTSQAFLATYENERLAREQAVKLASDNGASTLAQTKITVENTLRAAETGLQLAKNAYETTRKTHDLTLQQGAQSVEAASVRVRSAQSLFERLTVTAPVNGVIGTIQVDEGEDVTPGRQILEIASKDAECTITIESAMLDQLQVSAQVSVNYRGEVLKGSVASISPISNQGLNFSVTIAINDPVSVFGDFATVEIPMTSPFPTIPITAVTLLAPGQGEISTLVTDETGVLSIKKISVVLGTLRGNRIEILSDLPNGAQIILSDLKNFNPTDFVLRKK
ncbi:MAG: HlyD family efflux transporter periplasmic adaptor subunit [Candidatus Gracilibacteria bacterium]